MSEVLKEQSLQTKHEKIDQMINSGVHFGHKKSKWCPKMQPYVWGMRNKVYYIDVTKTLYIVEKAKEYLLNVTKKGGRVLWVGTKKSAIEVVGKVATELGHPYVNHRWIGGTLTNFEQVKKGVSKLLDLRDVVAKPLASLKKKEVVKIGKEVQRLEKNFGGIVGFRFPPSVVVVVDIKTSATAVKEALSCNIPVIGLVDTNSDPTGLAITIPTNDDSTKAISLILSMLAEGAKEGMELHRQAKAAEQQKTLIDKALDHSKSGDNRNASVHNKKNVAPRPAGNTVNNRGSFSRPGTSGPQGVRPVVAEVPAEQKAPQQVDEVKPDVVSPVTSETVESNKE